MEQTDVVILLVGSCVFAYVTFITYGIGIFQMNKKELFFGTAFLILFKINLVYSFITFTNNVAFSITLQNWCSNCSTSEFFRNHTLENYSNIPFFISHCIQVSMPLIQHSIIFLFAVQRCTTFLLSIIEDFFEEVLPFILLAITLFPFLFTWHLLTEHAYSGIKDHSFILPEADVHLLVLIFKGMMTIGSLIAIIAGLYYRSRLTMPPEKGFLYMVIMMFIIQLVALTVDILIQYSIYLPFPVGRFATISFPYVSFLMTFHQPWLSLVFSRHTRKLYVDCSTAIKQKIKLLTMSICQPPITEE